MPVNNVSNNISNITENRNIIYITKTIREYEAQPEDIPI